MRYRRFITYGTGWCIRHIPGLQATINNPYDHHFGEKQMMYICNHQSVFDIIYILSLTSKMIVLTKEWVWKNPFLGVILRLTDCLPITYGNEVNLEQMKEMVAKGYSIMIFPEGTRTKNGDIGRFHRGAFYVAEQLSLDICPLLIKGMFSCLSKNEFRIRPAKVELQVLPIIKVNDNTFGYGYKERTKHIEKYYDSMLNKLPEDTVGIIGAGVGGLFTATLLSEKGYQVTLLEQSSIIGGGLSTFQRLGEVWQTGTHAICGLEEDGIIKNILDRLDIKVPIEETYFDNKPIGIIGEYECEFYNPGAYRLVGGSQRLVDELCKYIIRHGGRILTQQEIVKININSNRVSSVETTSQSYSFENVVSSIHPKVLLNKVTENIFKRPITANRILSAKESLGAFKLYIKLKPNTLLQDKITHYIHEDYLLVLTPPAEINQKYARTIECVLLIEYAEIEKWSTNRTSNYDEYKKFKKIKTDYILDKIQQQIYPNIHECIEQLFAATPLTFRDTFLTPEGAVFGIDAQIGFVTTKIPNLYITGQNCFWHGVNGAVRTAIETVNAIEYKYE